jgi:hypothetical protein
MVGRRMSHLFALISLSIGSRHGLAQAPAGTMRLAPANASLREEFSVITGARELKDGRVVVTDPREGRIVVADLGAGTVVQISRKGEGPGEYPRALPVRPVGGDSSVLIDSPRRWLVFDGARIVATLPPDAPAVAATKGLVRGVDAQGFVYSADFVAGGKQIGDSTALLRVSRATGHVDTIVRLAALVAKQASAANKDGFFEFSIPAIGTAEEAVPFPDGRLAVVRVNPYRVDWRTMDGRWIRGAALPFVAVAMDEQEKRAYMARVAAASGKPASPPESITGWPTTVPPYQSPTTLFAAPDGRVLVPRMPSSAHPETRYDVVNRRGTLDGQLVLPANERIVGFGTTSVYVAATDDDGIQRLRRSPWPPLPTGR